MTEKFDDEYSNLFKETDWEKWDSLSMTDKWDDYLKVIQLSKCKHFGEVNIFGLIPITCYNLTTEKIISIIKEKNIKSWLILDIGCLLNIDIDKIDTKFYFAPINDFDVPSFETMNTIIEFIHDNLKNGNILVSCIGGHGRTGIVLSVWAGLNNIETPVNHIRKIYCNEAVETVSQEMFVNIYLKYLKSL